MNKPGFKLSETMSLTCWTWNMVRASFVKDDILINIIIFLALKLNIFKDNYLKAIIEIKIPWNIFLK